MASAQHLTPLVPGESSATLTIRLLTGQIPHIERMIKKTTHYHLEEQRGQQKRLDTGRFVLGTILAAIDGMQDAAKLLPYGDSTLVEGMVVPPRDDEAAYLIAAFSNGDPTNRSTWVLRCCTRRGSEAAGMDLPRDIEVVRAACVQWGMAVLDLFIAARHYANPEKGTEVGKITFHNLRARAHAQTVALCIGEMLRRQRVDPATIRAGAREALKFWCSEPREDQPEKKMVDHELDLITQYSGATLGFTPVVAIPSADGDPSKDANIALTNGVAMLAMGVHHGSHDHTAPTILGVDGVCRDVNISLRTLGVAIGDWLRRHGRDHENLSSNALNPAIAFVEHLQHTSGRHAITDLTA